MKDPGVWPVEIYGFRNDGRIVEHRPRLPDEEIFQLPPKVAQTNIDVIPKPDKINLEIGVQGIPFGFRPDFQAKTRGFGSPVIIRRTRFGVGVDSGLN